MFLGTPRPVTARLAEDAPRAMLDRALGDARVDSLVAPFLTGELICRKRESLP